MLRHRRSQESGFTITELVMVIVILGILSITILSSNPTDTASMMEVEQLVQAIRQAQAGSLDDTSGYNIRYLSSSSFEVRNNSNTTLSTIILDQATVSNFGTITFDGYGEPDNPSTITITGSGSSTAQVRVTQETGYADIL
ncbi:MAG: type II secretion system protein [Magnetococcales bacterium]|nr:type II secretion system protein [Magnetococcales bacterium]